MAVSSIWFGIVLAFGAMVLATDAAAAISPGPQQREAGLTAFRSDAELQHFLERHRRAVQRSYGDSSIDEVVVTGSRVEDTITNTQETGVDEGGIVKVSGDTLVILRRGRLFTVSLEGGGMRPVAVINAYPPGVETSRGWYDEMLVVDDWVVVIGFSYGRGGTEINRFKLGADGGLSFHDAYHLRSNDYYSASNFASRLIDDTLVLYTPMEMGWHARPLEILPAMRTWRGDADGGFRPIHRARDLYVVPSIKDTDSQSLTLHTVTRCQLTAPTLDCEAIGVFGPRSRSFYVSPEAVYLWMSSDDLRRGRKPGRFDTHVIRLPLDGDRPQAARTRGAPLNQFSFREDSQTAVLNVLLGPDGTGDGMWSSHGESGALSLLQLPLSRFGDGTRPAWDRDYRTVPAIPDHSWQRRNRFVGRSLLYSGEISDAAGDPAGGVLHVVNLDDHSSTSFQFPEAITRIEPVGRDAMVVGGQDDVAMTLVELGSSARLTDRFILPRAQEAESRSHGFFYRPDASDGEAQGVMGLPVVRKDDDGEQTQAEMIFLRRAGSRLSPAGDLQSQARPLDEDGDGCVASCVDWYGNARPIFWRGRVFALLGYELVEGREGDGRISEIGRIDFSPRQVVSPRPYSP